VGDPNEVNAAVPKVDSSDSKSSKGTLLAVAGLLLSLFGNYEQYRKNESDRDIANKQIQILQQQADSASGQLDVAKGQLAIAQSQLMHKQANCDGSRSEHDDALRAVHMDEESISKYEAELISNKSALAMAEQSKDEFKIARYRSLADSAQTAIDSFKSSRDVALARVKQLEEACKF
jgi:chromosome segregation ATPase